MSKLNGIQLTIHGEPIAKGRPRFNGKYTYTPAKTREYETRIKDIARREYSGELLTGGILLNVKAYFGIPKSWSKKKRDKAIRGDLAHVTRPDCTNVLKAVEDGLNGVIYKDDSQIIKTSLEKCYSEEPRVEVSIHVMEEARIFS